MAEGMIKDKIPALAKTIEASRSAAHKRYVKLMAIGTPMFLVGIVLGALYAILNWSKNAPAVLFAVVALFLAGAILMIVAGITRRNYSGSAYSLLVNTIDATLFPNAKKDPNRGLVLNVLLKPGFFATPDRYYGRNYKTATYEGIPFEQAGYDLQRRESHTDSKGNTYYTYETYAKGTMYRFQFERNFCAIVKILEKSGFLTFGAGNLKKIETEYIAFNKKFQVLASDETSVFYLLTPQIQEKIMDLEGKFKGKFYMAFIGNELFIAVNDDDQSIVIPFSQAITEENLTAVVECLAIPAVFITLLGLNKAKFQKDAGTTVS